MIKRLHVIAAATGFVTILAFWLSTVLTVLLGSHRQIADTRQAVVWGLLVLIPALGIAGLTGSATAGGATDPGIIAKKHRMLFIVGVGLLILVPAALYLDVLASRGEIGTLFYTVQAVESAAGAISLALMSLNIRDGRRLASTVSRVEGHGTGRSLRT
jgi:hypothetical protein